MNNGDTPALTNEGVFSANDLRAYICLGAGCKAPCPGAEGFVEDTAVFNFGKVD